MPMTAPPRAPRPTEPAAQPMRAPTPTLAAVTPPSNAPAPAGSNDARGVGSIAASISELVTLQIRHFSTKTATFRPTLYTRYRGVRARLPRRDDRPRAAGRPGARERRQRLDDVGGGAASRRPVRARDRRPARLSAESAARAARLRGAGGGDRRDRRSRRPSRRPLLRRRP